MKNARNQRMMSAAILAGVIAAGAVLGPSGLLAVTGMAAPAATGLGFWAALGCVGCVAGFIIGSGTTVAGLAVFLAVNPELGILCVATCAAAT